MGSRPETSPLDCHLTWTEIFCAIMAADGGLLLL
jgi:hypothetical protein